MLRPAHLSGLRHTAALACYQKAFDATPPKIRPSAVQAASLRELPLVKLRGRPLSKQRGTSYRNSLEVVENRAFRWHDSLQP